jgi:hypothetical protein
MKTNTRSFALRALAIITVLLSVAVIVVAMQSDQQAKISGVSALLVSAACFSIAALFVLSGRAYTRLGNNVEKSTHPVLFWLLTMPFLLGGIRCLFLI